MKKPRVHRIHHVPKWPSYFCKLWVLCVSQIYTVYIFTIYSLLGEEMERWRKWNICLVELQSFSAFVMLKVTFSKHLLVKLAWQVFTSSLKQKWLQLQMKIACDDYLKIALWWRRNETFDSERFKPMKVGFPDGGNESIFGCWLGIFPIPSVFHKDSGE